MPLLLGLPQELIGNVLTFLDACDLVSFGATCKYARSHLDPSSNQLLWRSAFLHAYDEPISAYRMQRHTSTPQQRTWDWYHELKRRFMTSRYLDRHTEARFEHPLDEETMIEVLLDMIDTSKSCFTHGIHGEIHVPESPSRHADWKSSKNILCIPDREDFSIAMDQLVRETRLVDPNIEPAIDIDRPLTRSMSINRLNAPRSNVASRLHTLSGVTVREERDRKALGRARCIVYDWALTTAKSEWSPCKDDGSGEVDWKRLEAIMTVCIRSFQTSLRGRLVLPQGFKYSIPHRTLRPLSAPHDWARVTGNWCGTYVFLNWEDLLEYNMWPGPESGRPNLDDGPEQCGGLMKLDLRLDETIKDDPRLQSELPMCEDLPPLYFSGLSKSYDWSLATAVRGRVSLVPGGREVRWKFIVRYVVNFGLRWGTNNFSDTAARTSGPWRAFSPVAPAVGASTVYGRHVIMKLEDQSGLSSMPLRSCAARTL